MIILFYIFPYFPCLRHVFTIQIVFFLSLSHSLLLNNPLSALNGIWGLTLKYIYCIYCIYLSYIYYRGTHKEWDFTEFLQLFYNIIGFQVSEFNEFEPQLLSAKNRFQLSAGFNIEKLNTILSGTNHIWDAA